MDAYFRNWCARFKFSLRPLDPWLYVPAGSLLALGLLMVLNTTYFLSREKTGDPFHYFKLHLLHIAVGVAIGAVVSQFSLAGLRRLVLPLGITALALLTVLWLPGIGVVRGGARRWVRFGPLLLEPTELVKFAAVFMLADFLTRRQTVINQFARGPLPVFVIFAPVALMVLRQPDFGATVMIVVIMFAMLFAAGARANHLGGAGAAAAGVFALQAVARPYRMRRLSAFMDPWRTARGAGFQLIQSFIALGEGGAWGTGLGAGRQKMFYLPQAHTDFVFAVIVEEFGLIGAFAVLAAFAVILFRGMRIAHEDGDAFGSLLAVGMTALLSLQALINIAVVIGLVPTKGLPLPFLSYGGTSMVMAMATLGALLALSRRLVAR